MKQAGRFSLRSATYLILIGLVLLFPTNARAERQNTGSLRERVRTLEKRLNKADDDSFDKLIRDFGGRIQYDVTINHGSDDALSRTVGTAGVLEDGSEFRRLYLNVSGEIHQPITYRVELDFAGNDVTIRDAYVKYSQLPLIDEILIGRYKEPLTIDQMTSNLHGSMMSRSSISNAFHTGWNNGLLWSKHFLNNQYNLSIGTYLSNDNNGSSLNASGGKWNLTGRLTTPLIYLFEGRRILHLGAGYSIRQPGDPTDPDTDVFSSVVRPEVHQTNSFLRIRVPSVDSYSVGNLELAGVNGPLSYQVEYIRQTFDRLSGNEPELDGFYVQADLFLTGEIRPYNRKAGRFGRVRPRRPFIGNRPEDGQWGPGAWQVVGRYSSLDYRDARDVTTMTPSLASEMDIVSVGLNWFINSRSRWMINYFDADQKSLGDGQYVTTRFQVDF